MSFPNSVAPSQSELRSLRPSLLHRVGIYSPFLGGNKGRPSPSVLRYADLRSGYHPSLRFCLYCKTRSRIHLHHPCLESPNLSSFPLSKVLAVIPWIARALLCVKHPHTHTHTHTHPHTHTHTHTHSKHNTHTHTHTHTRSSLIHL